MRWKFGRRQPKDYSCCFCCHIRMGAMFLGIFYLLLDLLAVTLIATLTMYPDLVQQDSNIMSRYLGIETTGANNATLPLGPRNNGTLWVLQNPLDCDAKLFGLFVAIGCSIFTVCLLYGVITGRPRYLLPFFCLQVFDFCATSFSFISYFSVEPEIKKWIASQKLMPFKEELLSLSTDWLLIVAAIVAVAFLWIKGYCVIVVWSCYKYLIRGEAVTRVQTIGADRSCETYEDCRRGDDRDDPSQVQIQIALPPKYEDIIMHTPILSPSSPPPYVAMETERRSPSN